MAAKNKNRKVSLHISAEELARVFQDGMLGIRIEAIITHANVKVAVATDEGKRVGFQTSSQRLSEPN
jgi:ABC-type uncharacterized transport system ATPase component